MTVRPAKKYIPLYYQDPQKQEKCTAGRASSISAAQDELTHAKKYGRKPKDVLKSDKISLNEIRAQISLNTLTKPSIIATIVKRSSDLNVAIWASTYSAASVRAAAASHSFLPFGRLLRMIFFDQSKTVVAAAMGTLITHHSKNISQLFHFIEDFPQLSLPFNIGQVVPKETTLEDYREAKLKYDTDMKIVIAEDFL